MQNLDFQHLDVIVRIAAATTLLLTAAGLLRDARQKRITPYFFLLAIGASGFVAGNTPYPALTISGAAGVFWDIASGFAALFVWWFVLALFDDEFRLGAPEIGVGAIWITLALADRGYLHGRFADAGLSWLLVAIAFGMSAHLIVTILRNRENDFVDARRRARPLLAFAMAAMLAADIMIDITFGLDWKPQGLTLFQNSALLAVALWLASLLLHGDASALLFERRAAPQPAPAASDRPAPDDQPDREDREAVIIDARIRALIDNERLHLDPALTFADFARRLHMSQAATRRHINHRLGYRHFRSFLNAARLQEARTLLADPARADDKIAAIAFDSGFASLASFHRAFSAAEGRTPGAYRDDALGKTRHSGAQARFERSKIGN